MKPYFTKMAIHLLFTVHKLRPLHAFSSILNLIEAKQSIHQNVQYFIWSKKSVFYFTAVRYSLHKCSERILWLKWQFTIHCFLFCALELMEAIFKTCYRVLLGPQSGQFSTMKSFATKIVSSRLPRCWSSEARSVALLGSMNQMQLKGARPTAKRVVIVFRIHNGHVELLSTYLY